MESQLCGGSVSHLLRRSAVAEEAHSVGQREVQKQTSLSRKVDEIQSLEFTNVDFNTY